MAEVKKNDVKEIRIPSAEKYKMIHPERGMTIDKARSIIDRLFEKPEQYYNPTENRIKFASHSDGTWSGEIGNSRLYPNKRETKEDLEKYDQSFIEYKDGNPDFSRVSEATVIIEDMTSYRPSNFKQADIKCSEQWNKIEREGRTDWTPRDVKQWRQDNKYSWHERIDRKTMDLVPRAIHDECKHFGGCSECKQYEKENGIGGNFDE